VVLVDECVHIRGVSWWIENGQGGILVAGAKKLASSQGKRGGRGCDCELETVWFHRCFSFVGCWIVSKSLLPEVKTGFADCVAAKIFLSDGSNISWIAVAFAR